MLRLTEFKWIILPLLVISLSISFVPESYAEISKNARFDRYTDGIHFPETLTYLRIQSENFPDLFIRHQDHRCKIAPINSPLDKTDSKWEVVHGLKGKGTVSFKTWHDDGNGFFLSVLPDNTIEVKIYEETDSYKESASFFLESSVSDKKCYSIKTFRGDRYLRHRNALLYAETLKNDLDRRDAAFRFKITDTEYVNSHEGYAFRPVSLFNKYAVFDNKQQGRLIEIKDSESRALSGFKIVPGLIDKNYISFESKAYPGHYLQTAQGKLKLSKDAGSTHLKSNATFIPTPGLSDPSRISFRSYSSAESYLINHDGKLVMSSKRPGNADQNDATFVICTHNDWSNRVLIVFDKSFRRKEHIVRQYAQNTTAAGTSVIVEHWGDSLNERNVEDLRALIKTHYEHSHIDGVFLVGDLPYKNYKNPERYNFPCDLYLMDMDDHWKEDENGILIEHGRIHLEIYLSRILSKERPVADIERYFDKLDKYRKNGLPPEVTKRGYAMKLGPYHVGMNRMYSDYSVADKVYIANTPEYIKQMTTLGAEYVFNWAHGFDRGVSYGNLPDQLSLNELKQRVVRNRKLSVEEKKFVIKCYESTPGDSQYQLKNLPDNEMARLFAIADKAGIIRVVNFTIDDIEKHNIRGVFHNIGSCYVGHFSVEVTCYALSFLMKTDYGLASTASTIPPSIQDVNSFHAALGSGSTWGQAFLAWYNNAAARHGHPCLGRVLFGDPTLKLSD